MNSAFGDVFLFLTDLAWKSRLTIPILVTTAFLVMDIRLQIEINIQGQTYVTEIEEENFYEDNNEDDSDDVEGFSSEYTNDDNDDDDEDENGNFYDYESEPEIHRVLHSMNIS